MEAPSNKVFLLLQPAKLLHRSPVLQLLKVTRQHGSVEMEELPIQSGIVSLHAKKLDAEARKILMRFSEAECQKEKLAIELRFEKQHTEKSFERFKDRQIARYYLQALGQLKQYNQQLGWYHRLPVIATNRVVTAPCTYHPLSVLLEFSISISGNLPVIETTVLHGSERSPISQFRRYYFLLEKEHQYWHLTLKSYEAIEWLKDHPFDAAQTDAKAYALLAGDHLRNEGHTVHMAEVEPVAQLEVEPAKRVMLSELNNSFLMLTPQYV